MSSNTQKLRVLRSRTDHDLMILVQQEIDRGLALVPLANSRISPHFVEAERAMSRASALLGRIAGLPHADRQRMDAQLLQLRTQLEQSPYRVRAAS